MDNATFDNPISDAYVTRDWLRASNALAAGIVRGKSTPESRLNVKRREYEIACRALGRDFNPTVTNRRNPDTASAGGREDSYGSDRVGGERADDSPLYWNKPHENLYGAGRAYERAIQETRFPGVEVRWREAVKP